MRRPLTTLRPLATCGSLALVAAGTLVALMAAGTHAATNRADTARRSWTLTLTPAPDEMALARVSFRRSRGKRLTRRVLQVAVEGPFGDDYLAAATPSSPAPGASQALVLVIDRPSPLLDPVAVRLRITALRSLGAPTVRTLAGPLQPPTAHTTPALCALPRRGAAISGSQLNALASRGGALAGFSAASAVAQAYDLACGLPYESAFVHAVEQPSPGSPEPIPPVPGPPVPGPPQCTPCDPPPGYACPLAVAPSVCVAPVTGAARRADAHAH
jgi:hypothetical protein